MSHRARRCAALVRAIAIPLLAAAAPGVSAAADSPDDPTVWEYAQRCFARLRVDPEDLRGPFRCTAGKPLRTRVHGKVMDIGACSGSGCPTDFPGTCDFPAWLAADENCYGHSYIQVIQPKSNPSVRAALLCRHKSEWTDDEANFDDIAMIVHNQRSGETCWFQTPSDDASVNLDGRSVPGPAHVADHAFWLRPTRTAKVGCVRCHDSSPFMVSEWMRRTVGDDLDDEHFHPYKNSEKPFDRWPTPRFVRIGRFGLAEGDPACTSCHKIAARVEASVDLEGFPPETLETQTCGVWIDWATGALDSSGDQPIPGQNDTRNTRKVWMPDFGDGNFGAHSRAEFDRRYRAHVDHLKKCCAAVGRTKPGDPIPLRDCEEHIPKVRTPAAGG